MKIYTGTGDKGKTSLFSGERIPKNNDRIEAYGNVDELNSVIGALIAALGDRDELVTQELMRIQSDLFAIGAWLATSPESTAAGKLHPFTSDPAARLEAEVDRIDAGLKPLMQFILPGGHATAAWAHVARTVCRRTERRMVALAASTPTETSDDNFHHALVYLNRLSDYFFVLARHCNNLYNVEEQPWEPEKP